MKKWTQQSPEVTDQSFQTEELQEKTIKWIDEINEETDEEREKTESKITEENLITIRTSSENKKDNSSSDSQREERHSWKWERREIWLAVQVKRRN